MVENSEEDFFELDETATSGEEKTGLEAGFGKQGSDVLPLSPC